MLPEQSPVRVADPVEPADPDARVRVMARSAVSVPQGGGNSTAVPQQLQSFQYFRDTPRAELSAAFDVDKGHQQG
jgi:hypothetical protein